MNNEEKHDTEASKHPAEIMSDAVPVLGYTSDPVEETPPIAELIKLMRKEKGLSQIELSQKIDVTNVQLSRIERGECTPTVRTLIKLAPHLGYSLETLLAASHYQGTLPSSTPTYVDLEGQMIDLGQAARSMYRIDGELFLLFWNFFRQYSSYDSEVLKVLLKGMAKSHLMTEQEENASPGQPFTDAFTHLKQFILSFGKMASAATD